MLTTVAIRMHKSSPLVPLVSCLTAAACLSSACSFAVPQASDLALLIGYVAYEDLNFNKSFNVDDSNNILCEFNYDI